MPDGDMVYGKLRQGYEKPYEQLCEGHFGSPEIAYNLVSAVRANAKRFGEAPRNLLFQAANLLESLPQEPILRPTIDFAQTSHEIDQIARTISPGHSKRAMELAREACKAHLRAFQEGAFGAEHRPGIVYQYLIRIFDAEFCERVPMTNHYNGVDHAVFMERLCAVRPYVEQSLRFIADAVARRGTWDRVRIPQPDGAPITADTDVFALV